MGNLDFDLLGDPIPEGFGKRGRPPHRATDEKRRLIIQLLAFGKTEDEVSSALGITKTTLRKYYLRELKAKDEARVRVEAKCLDKLMEQVEAGKVAAIKEYFVRLERADQLTQAATIAHRGQSVAAASLPSAGKKANRKQQAGDYAGKFAPPSSPDLLN
ncbi:hypothetical protein [Pseudovibrio sp. Tun.PSC04-5.I4]|uniref:hypothetical protein n=1 Tax=Pseudovibrio sp. Tun.PSC04-5.I4 TaxID=1798213 RepID=UPI00087EABB1|nr:hypothetical protein [Pseudovibrio sp. Tun.PSC04-5.I4]SDR20041.1 hypothetical protein SAMN04515695_3358 [Pseudovibrio sp. Tun.PSC04-5.I4]